MTKNSKDSVETCLRLIEAACKIFSEKGFKNTRISDISDLAGINNALINYHFCNKKNLYKEAWRYAHRISQNAYPLDSSKTTPEGHLRIYIDSLLRRIYENRYDFAFIQHEFSNPTGLLDEIMKNELKPQYEKIIRVISELLGPNASIKKIQFCHASIIGQCFHLFGIVKNSPPEYEEREPSLFDDIDAYIEHVYNFSLAGIENMREHNPV